MRLYAYCVCEEEAAGAAEGDPGVNGAAVRAVVCGGGLAAVVSELGTEAPAVTPENVRAHNRVNARVLAREAPLPFRFGTVVAGPRLADYLKTNEGALREALARVRGCVEMGVKVMWGARAAPPAGEEEGGAFSTTDGDARVEGSGTAFLLAKRREILGGEAERARAEEVAAWLDARVLGVVRDARVAVLPSRALVVRAAHLVECARLEEYRSRVRALEAERAAELNFLTSGPWPPYSFSNVNS